MTLPLPVQTINEVYSFKSVENRIPGIVVGQREMSISHEGERALAEIENRPSRIDYPILGIDED